MTNSKLFSSLLFTSVLMSGAFAQGVNLVRATDSSESASIEITPTQTPTPTPETEASFPACQELLQNPGDHASWQQGWHQIVGGPLLYGSDDVYSLENGNYVQCFCPEEGSDGIQTNWWKTLAELQGWFVENGFQWNLGDYRYLAQNTSFVCGDVEPTPTPIPGPTPTQSPDPTPTPTTQPSTSSGVGGTSASTTSNTTETQNEVAAAVELAFTGSGYADAIKMFSGLVLSFGSWIASRKSR